MTRILKEVASSGNVLWPADFLPSLFHLQFECCAFRKIYFVTERGVNGLGLLDTTSGSRLYLQGENPSKLEGDGVMVSASDLHGLIGMMPRFHHRGRLGSAGQKHDQRQRGWSAAWTGQSATA